MFWYTSCLIDTNSRVLYCTCRQMQCKPNPIKQVRNGLRPCAFPLAKMPTHIQSIFHPARKPISIPRRFDRKSSLLQARIAAPAQTPAVHSNDVHNIMYRSRLPCLPFPNTHMRNPPQPKTPPFRINQSIKSRTIHLDLLPRP